jgi:hypothetical protein
MHAGPNVAGRAERGSRRCCWKGELTESCQVEIFLEIVSASGQLPTGTMQVSGCVISFLYGLIAAQIKGKGGVCLQGNE